MDIIQKENVCNKRIKSQSLRLCLTNVPIEMTKPDLIRTLIEDFPNVNVYMPKNTRNEFRETKVVFIDFQRAW